MELDELYKYKAKRFKEHECPPGFHSEIVYDSVKNCVSKNCNNCSYHFSGKCMELLLEDLRFIIDHPEYYVPSED